MKMSQIKLEGLRKEFGKSIALDELNLEIYDKELIVLLGPSGCGKTTTLNCIAGIEEPTSGHIYFDDTDVTELPPHTRNVAMVFQSALLYPHLPSRENIKMSLRTSRMTKEEMEKRVEETAKLLEIHPLLEKMPYQMSGGERQRVATAKAIVRNPSCFLMDEPFASLDAALREVFRAEIAVLQKKLGITMVFVTHDQVEAMTMGDRIAVMSAGKLQQVGTPDEIYSDPINTFVARFVGSPPMNFFEGRVKRLDERFLFEHSRFHIELPEKLVARCKESIERDGLTLGVRPQHITLHDKQKEGTLKGKIYAIERLGKETVVIVQYEDEEKFKALVSPPFLHSMDDVIYSQPQADHVYLFDSRTGENLLEKKSM
jgi:ABC-type sugar transport system ATPase subunit